MNVRLRWKADVQNIKKHVYQVNDYQSFDIDQYGVGLSRGRMLLYGFPITVRY